MFPLTFGVEVEFSYAHNINSYLPHYQGSTVSELPNWKLKTDSSCGYEIVSPILNSQHMDEVETSIRSACDFLRARNAEVNRKCGLHIHVGCNEIFLSDKPENEAKMANFLAHMTKYQEAIFNMVPLHRRTNSYCAKLPCHIIDGIKKYQAKAWRTNDSTLQTTGRPTRYTWLNGVAWEKYGTIEFRVMEATLNADDIIGWIYFYLVTANKILSTTENISAKPSSVKSSAVLFHNFLVRSGFFEKTEIAKKARRWAMNRYEMINGVSYRAQMRKETEAKREKCAIANQTTSWDLI